VQGRRVGFLQQRLEHQVLAAALSEAGAVFLAQSRDLGVAMLALDPAALVAMTVIETCSSLGDAGFPLARAALASRRPG
jgi:hypothetical protein